MTAEHRHPYAPQGRRVEEGGINQTGFFCDFLNQTSCSKLCVILPTDDGFYSLFTSILSSGICKSVKEGVNSIASAVISFASGASRASNVAAGWCSWLQCCSADTSLQETPTCSTSHASSERNSLFRRVCVTFRENGMLSVCPSVCLSILVGSKWNTRNTMKYNVFCILFWVLLPKTYYYSLITLRYTQLPNCPEEALWWWVLSSENYTCSLLKRRDC